MESLHLPQDLYWDGKLEPLSPPSELFSLTTDDTWLFEDNFAKDVLLIDKCENLDEASLEGELLYEFEYDVKQEQWIDGKPDGLPLVDFSSAVLPQPAPAQVVKVQNPYEIIMELEKFYGSPELTQLTPPQTPPQEAIEPKDVFNIIQQPTPCSEVVDNEIPSAFIPAMSPASSNVDYSSDSTNPPMSPDIQREIQIVDEILRTRAKELPDWTDDECSTYSGSSSSVSQSNDEEWLPVSSSATPQSGKELPSHGNKRRVRPYGRGIEDKKSRKKEQNKNAATRYRQKKKQEMEEILEEERQLSKRNEELSKTVTDIEREIKYLKQLIREFHGNKKFNS